ncbi:hypothetical protein Q8A67_022855 [Cirrhinus molitorella]|uniref:Uncharacterized protein n=1 Tax=Cirrhinus molitorella TaxID=172907 RepID=A0AA88TDU2_9TELE|nr:hypothetical protein Q8A67_022855 [Cirrhinus molitorella]
MEVEVTHPDHDYCSSAELAAVDLVLNENAELRAEVATLRRQVEKLAISCKFGLERFAASDDDIRLYTRFASYAHLMSFWSQIEPALPDMVRVTATPGQDVRHYASTSVHN